MGAGQKPSQVSESASSKTEEAQTSAQDPDSAPCPSCSYRDRGAFQSHREGRVTVLHLWSHWQPRQMPANHPSGLGQVPVWLVALCRFSQTLSPCGLLVRRL